MLSVILACDDLYRTADLFVTRLGWRLEFATPRESDDRLACVALGDDQVMLGTADEQFLPAGARPHRGAGVEVYIRLPDSLRIEDVYHRHAMANVVTRPLQQREWGELAFQFEVDGYRFMIAQADVPSTG
jgi:catechol 2,3-dioxygenase-like lactoylglutathione lyase family enzyme